VILEWIASRKTDIIADQLGFLFSQITPDAECDIFNGKRLLRELMFIVVELKNNLSKKVAFLITEAFPGTIVKKFFQRKIFDFVKVNNDGSTVNIQVGDQTASIDLHSQPLVKEIF